MTETVTATVTVTATITATKIAATASSWCSIACYYLTNIESEPLLARHWTVAVIEPDEANDTLLMEVRKRSDLVLAYLNAGYAEEWRSYWDVVKDKPWIHGTTMYEGEYYVEYWHTEWRKILVELATRYLARGFQGIYLDNIDAAELLAIERPSWAQGVDPREAMIDLVCNVSNAVKAVDPKAKVYLNIGGAVNLLYNDRLLGCIDGVLREELWSHPGPSGPEPQDPWETLAALDALAYAHSHGKTVLVADPVNDLKEAWSFCVKAWSHGFIPVPQPAWALDYSAPPPPVWCSCSTSMVKSNK
ncbi:hypothetical protein Pyrde_1459 [Pyrodictium delaneyi]|uniref:Glycoside-hydrolase family GH114 TIM-barrel domain-containing protein n=1 Tax=Pyrodictium delaneyi TaxID=1273541 RepID=A0A0P0N4F6_9CREN|nr:endo alpha-1,4 polygalactosaminidase [Pyrodictium delaneyi]ALL01502.1 hypothetical protein Pyrde_1459 [Pyrodictium delaneyi]OWJ54591.1 hypothetical protein Pdsh_06065 [Pyrodictium delaneyi]